MPSQPEAEFGIAEARRILGEVFAPWVQDLNLSVERIEYAPPADAPDWQPGALLRMPFSEKLCRNGGDELCPGGPVRGTCSRRKGSGVRSRCYVHGYVNIAYSVNGVKDAATAPPRARG